MAIGEHIRWVVSHEVNGNILAEERSELLQKNEYMKSYAEIDTVPYDFGDGEKVEQIQHYDWIVVKTTLLLAHMIKRTETQNNNGC